MEKKKTTKKVPVKEKATPKKTAEAKSAKKILSKKERAAVGMETAVDAVSQKPAAFEGQASRLVSGESERAPDATGRAAPDERASPNAIGRERYFEAVGRRKTAVARVRLYTKAGDFMVNNKLHSAYFSTFELLKISEDALQKMKLLGRFKVTARIKGGGMHAQAEALRQGLSRCLVKFNPDFRKRLRRADFLKRDPRMKERKKPGLKRARKAPQWSKR